MHRGAVMGRGIWVSLVAVGVVVGFGCEEQRTPPPGVGPSGPGATATSGTGGDVGGAGGSGGTSTQGGGGTIATSEDCYDGVDNDLDGATDCITPDAECTAVCADPCSAPRVLADPGSYAGDTTGFAAVEGASCVAVVGGGATSVFAITVAHTGVLDVYLNGSSANFSLSARTSCSDAGTELGCSEIVQSPALDEHLLLPVTQGETVYLLVQGESALESGDYSIVAESRVVSCGDSKVDPPEECDDGNADPNDGCDDCALVIGEVEPNNTFATANPWSDPMIAQINPLGDIDVFTIAIPASNYSILANTFDLGNGACAMNQLDSQIFIALPDTTVLGSDDNSGDGLCARAAARNLSAGTLFVRVQAPGSNQSTFPYKLALEIDECGNAMVAAAEECDDGNTTSGDGCSASCTIE
jgi:cysteine-rich repeat protein